MLAHEPGLTASPPARYTLRVAGRALLAHVRHRSSDFGDDQPFAFVRDPDGYEIEIWHENTPHFHSRSL
jgi:catechol 2,3-dioxygenase-like lactoylglutathione lyase family enzyme